jgi:Phytanoyl-CoA dioxygenase (PhyH)
MCAERVRRSLLRAEDRNLMAALYVDPDSKTDDLRTPLYQGDLVLFSRVAAVRELARFARDHLEEVFAPHDPEYAHLYFSPEETASLLARWKPTFMRLERSRALVRAIIEEVGLPLSETYMDLLKPRTAFPVGHLTNGIAFAFPWHRDTWYAAPAQQINWWLPVFDVTSRNAMKFDLGSFAKPVLNTSSSFDYYQINKDRRKTAIQIKSESQARPAAIGHEPSQPLVVLGRPGSVLLFSGAQLHASIPNESGRSRFSIDFRTVDRRDVVSRTGAPLTDVECTGTSLRDFVQSRSGEPFDEDLVRSLHGVPPSDAVLTFSVEPAGTR